MGIDVVDCLGSQARVGQCRGDGPGCLGWIATGCDHVAGVARHPNPGKFAVAASPPAVSIGPTFQHEEHPALTHHKTVAVTVERTGGLLRMLLTAGEGPQVVKGSQGGRTEHIAAAHQAGIDPAGCQPRAGQRKSKSARRAGCGNRCRGAADPEGCRQPLHERRSVCGAEDIMATIEIVTLPIFQLFSTDAGDDPNPVGGRSLLPAELEAGVVNCPGGRTEGELFQPAAAAKVTWRETDNAGWRRGNVSNCGSRMFLRSAIGTSVVAANARATVSKGIGNRAEGVAQRRGGTDAGDDDGGSRCGHQAASRIVAGVPNPKPISPGISDAFRPRPQPMWVARPWVSRSQNSQSGRSPVNSSGEPWLLHESIRRIAASGSGVPVTSGLRQRASPRQVESFVGVASSSSAGGASQPVTISQIAAAGWVTASDIASVAAESRPSASAAGPPPTPIVGPCMPRPTLTAEAGEWSEHWGTTWGVTPTGPCCCKATIVRAAVGWPARQLAATTASNVRS